MDAAAVMDRVFAHLAEGDLEAAARFIHSDFVIREPPELPYGGEHRGPEGFLEVTRTGGEHYAYEVLNRDDLPLGDRLVVRLHARFTGRVTGASAEVHILELHTVRDGLLYESDIYYRSANAVAGLLPQPAATG